MSITDKGPDQKSGISMTNVSIGLIVVLVGLALLVGMNSSGPAGFSSPAPLAASTPTWVTVPSISAE